jgi:hypothetical protein
LTAVAIIKNKLKPNPNSIHSSFTIPLGGPEQTSLGAWLAFGAQEKHRQRQAA